LCDRPPERTGSLMLNAVSGCAQKPAADAVPCFRHKAH